MNLTLDDLVNEMLSVEKIESQKFTVRDRFQRFLKRREIEKQLQDEQQFESERILKSGKQAEDFLNSSHYSRCHFGCQYLPNFFVAYIKKIGYFS